MWAVRIPLEVLPFNNPDGPNILEFVKDSIVPFQAFSLQYC
jgi:hypothetical protein